MAGAVNVATLTATLVANTAQFNSAMNRAQASTVGTTSKLSGLKSVAPLVGLAMGGALVAGIKSSIDAFAESEKVAAQTNAVLKSTKGAANVTAKEISKLATEVSRYSGIDDEAVQSGENLLLTFTKVRNEAGKGNDVFSRATKVMADMSVALGQDLRSSAVQLGKALNDPVLGTTALRRAGVSFTEAQREQIQTLVESGKTLEAQKLILKELQVEFGGSAKAAGDTTTGAMNKLKVAVGNLQESLGALLAPALQRAAELLTAFAQGLQQGQPWAIAIAAAVGTLTVALGVATVAMIAMNLAVLANPFVAGAVALGVLIAALVVAYKKSEDFRNIVNAAFAAVKRVVGPILSGLVQVVKGAFEMIRGVVLIFSGLFTGDVSRMWEGVKLLFSGALNSVLGIVRALTAPIRTAAVALINAIKSGFTSTWEAVISWFRERPKAILSVLSSAGGAFFSAGRELVNMIARGVESAAGALLEKVRNLVQKARDLLPFSEPKDSSSPLYGLGDSGRAIVGNLAEGVASSTALTDAVRGKAAGVKDKITKLARLELSQALAALSDTGADDIAAAQAMVSYWTGRLNGLPSKSVAARTEAARNLLSARQELQRLLDAQAQPVPGFQGGVRNFQGGLAVVGERGPELVNLPPGSDVFSNARSRSMAGTTGHVFNLTVSALDPQAAATAVVRAIDEFERRNGPRFSRA